ncbi:polysaccharide biosynthesis/export family protein [Aquiflexum sp. LQ15W]|uniref:polysaccharide biosynthesis/export family protein n=1 Tax=Cognataquiflexum nitidum TaxID=2922272 RepID=UPI001F13A6C8|nr:polysaccharide biosynthesis/export family protein [Cognataquiflexum nitidum]MCH6201365.1 polysaccharide biosynthesis/export family protein [Cognataquiflexum nitidum]
MKSLLKTQRTVFPLWQKSFVARLVMLILIASSCVSNEKIIYVQNLKDNPPINEDEMILHDMPEYRLQFNDIIDVNIQTVEDMIQNGFNMRGNQMVGQMQMGGGGMGGGDIFYMTGYTIDKDGNVRLPIVGYVNVVDKTIDEARIEIETRIKDYVTSELFVNVKLGGIRFSTMGEFRAPGKFVVLQDRLTIFEALSMAGDLNIAAKRDEILLFRQYSEGTKLHRINLRDRQLISSPFYFVRPNDQLYAEPMKVREIGTGENAVQTFTLITTTLATVLLFINLLVD